MHGSVIVRGKGMVIRPKVLTKPQDTISCSTFAQRVNLVCLTYHFAHESDEGTQVFIHGEEFQRP